MLLVDAVHASFYVRNTDHHKHQASKWHKPSLYVQKREFDLEDYCFLKYQPSFLHVHYILWIHILYLEDFSIRGKYFLSKTLILRAPCVRVKNYKDDKSHIGTELNLYSESPLSFFKLNYSFRKHTLLHFQSTVYLFLLLHIWFPSKILIFNFTWHSEAFSPSNICQVTLDTQETFGREQRFLLLHKCLGHTASWGDQQQYG